MLAWLDRQAALPHPDAPGELGWVIKSSSQNEDMPTAQAQHHGRTPQASQPSMLISSRSAKVATRMEELRRAHERHVEEERAAEREKEERRRARAKVERERRNRVAAAQARAGSSSTLSSSSTPAPWPQGLPITGTPDAAAEARREANKSASLEQAAEHSARRRQQEEERVQEAQRKMEALKLAKLIQRGD
jgi:exonuclease VII large subunit